MCVCLWRIVCTGLTVWRLPVRCSTWTTQPLWLSEPGCGTPPWSRYKHFLINLEKSFPIAEDFQLFSSLLGFGFTFAVYFSLIDFSCFFDKPPADKSRATQWGTGWYSGEFLSWRDGYYWFLSMCFRTTVMLEVCWFEAGLLWSCRLTNIPSIWTLTAQRWLTADSAPSSLQCSTKHDDISVVSRDWNWSDFSFLC